jgi:hypothetical protein
VIAQLVLTILLCGVLVYAWEQHRRSPVVALLSIAAAFAGLYFVWIPAHSTWLADLMGIGRGVDLVLYVWVCISFIVLLNLHLKLRTQHELITTLARTIALANVARAADAVRHRETLAEPTFNADRPRRPSRPERAGGRRPRRMSDQSA